MYQQYLNQIQSSISNLNSDELKELLNDDEKLEEQINDSLKGLEERKSELLIENRTLAEENLTKEAEIIELKSKINELSDTGKELCTKLQEKLSEFKSNSGNVNKDTALALLQSAAAESEEESDKINKSFLESEIPLEQFLEQFIAIRKTMHLRKIKSEKLTELMRQQSNRGSAYVPPSSSFFNNPSTGGLPYPTGGISGVPYPTGPMMPMPMMPMPPRPY